MSCDTGYSLNGEPQVICSDNGTWEISEAPECGKDSTVFQRNRLKKHCFLKFPTSEFFAVITTLELNNELI